MHNLANVTVGKTSFRVYAVEPHLHAILGAYGLEIRTGDAEVRVYLTPEQLTELGESLCAVNTAGLL